VIAVADAFAPATLVACALGVVALPVWWRLVRRCDAVRSAPPPARPIQAFWPVPVGLLVFVTYIMLSAAALYGLQQSHMMAARLALAAAIAIGIAVAAVGLPRLTRTSVGIGGALGLGLLTFMAALPVVYGIAYVESLIFGELPAQSMVEKIAEGGPGVRELVFLAVAVAPFLEEVIFRGLFFCGLRRTRSPRVALYFSACLFGLVHAEPPVAILPMVALGLFLGWLMERTGSLLACFVAHAAFNLLSVSVLVFS